mgnify:CR=1 FL=1
MRSIVRFSVDGETDGQLRNRLAAQLTDAGFVLNPHVTATYEHNMINEHELAGVMQQFWYQAMNPPNSAHVDHVWMYADNPPAFELQFPDAGGQS